MTDATALGLAIKAGGVDPSALASAVCDAMRDRAGLGAVVTLFDEDAIREAITEAWAKGGPFAGVPMLAKDLGAAAAGLRQGVGVRGPAIPAPARGPGGRGAADAALPGGRACARRPLHRTGIRLRAVGGATGRTRGAQPVRHGKDARRLLGRGGCGRRGRHCRHRPCHRRRRVHPRAGLGLRALGAETLARGGGVGGRSSPTT